MRGQPSTLVINSLVSSTQTAADVTSDDNFFCVFTSNVMISSVEASLTGHLKTRAKAPIDFRTLAAWWMISPQQAQNTITITVTTQRGGCVQASTQLWLVDFQQMTECYTTNGSHTQFLPILYLLALPLLEVTNVPRYTPRLLVGVELIP